jgi:hypothetical protein
LEAEHRAAPGDGELKRALSVEYARAAYADALAGDRKQFDGKLARARELWTVNPLVELARAQLAMHHEGPAREDSVVAHLARAVELCDALDPAVARSVPIGDMMLCRLYLAERLYRAGRERDAIRAYRSYLRARDGRQAQLSDSAVVGKLRELTGLP